MINKLILGSCIWVHEQGRQQKTVKPALYTSAEISSTSTVALSLDTETVVWKLYAPTQLQSCDDPSPKTDIRQDITSVITCTITEKSKMDDRQLAGTTGWQMHRRLGSAYQYLS